MHDWFKVIASGCDLSASVAQNLHDVGFVVIPGPLTVEELA
jgi:hypothetical protein